MGPLAIIIPWVFASVCVGLGVGFFIGRSRVPENEASLALERERQATLKMLVELLGTAERISTDVETHNGEIRQNAEQVSHICASGELEFARAALLHHMTALLSSNKRLQDDLLCTRYRLEEQAQEMDNVRREARTDEVTTVANRKAFNEKLHLLVETWIRQHQPFALILADLDNFKWINDAHGHQAGDRVLKSVGTWLRQWVREGDFVGRYGGDEFAVLLPYTELGVAVELAETIRDKTNERSYRVAVRGEQVSVSLSLGVAAPVEGDTLDTLLGRADEALYKAKRLGRNQVQSQPAATPAALPTVAPESPTSDQPAAVS
jgi:diguanylate cyclase